MEARDHFGKERKVLKIDVLVEIYYSRMNFCSQVDPGTFYVCVKKHMNLIVKYVVQLTVGNALLHRIVPHHL